MSITNELARLPLFSGVAESRLERLVGAMKPSKKKAATILFEPGELASTFDVLTKGEVTLEEEGGARYQLRPTSPIGELSALTGIPRSTKAVATTDVEILSVPVKELHAFFDANPDLALVFTKNLLGLVADKVRRDHRMLGSMRANIIRTQKAMKQMRDLVLESQENELSKPICETLESLIDNNRRANYRVSPTAAYPAFVRHDDGRKTAVLELSEGYLKVEGTSKELTQDPSYWAGVLTLPGAEILVSGSVLREDKSGVVVKLDGMVDDFKAKYDDYTKRLQLLDFAV